MIILTILPPEFKPNRVRLSGLLGLTPPKLNTLRALILLTRVGFQICQGLRKGSLGALGFCRGQAQ